MNSSNNFARFFRLLSKKLKRDKVFSITFFSVIVLVIALIVVICVSCSRKDDEDVVDDQEEMTQEQTEEQAQSTDVNLPDYTVKDVALEENAHADVNDFISNYFQAMTNGDTALIQSMQPDVDQKELLKMQKESAYIDEFSNLKTYTKPGPLQGSYVAFVYYEIKFTDIATLAPGLTTLYICPKDEGGLMINGALSDQDSAYVKDVVAQDDVADLFSLVQTKYNDAVAADESLNTFMLGLAAKLDAEVSEAMAQIEAENAPENPEAAEGEAVPAENVKEEKVKATDTVNVRSSDSENADRIGQVAMGETLTRYEAKENGWSRVEYNGGEGYIKSEFLQAEGAPSEEAQAPAEQPQETENAEPAQGNSLAGKSKISIKETVNVRKSASQDAEKLGVAYQGENYDLIMEQADGWCKIKFNGETGYVKTEFVE